MGLDKNVLTRIIAENWECSDDTKTESDKATNMSSQTIREVEILLIKGNRNEDQNYEKKT